MGGDSFPDSDVLVNQDQRQIPELNQITRIVGHGYQHRVLTVWVAVARTEVKQYTMEVQSTLDNSNLQGKSKKGSSYRESEENRREYL